MDQLIAYCGVDCSACPDFADKTCPSCRLTLWNADNVCMPVECCRNKDIEVCGRCDIFPCEDMAQFYEESESHREAYRRMLGQKR